MTATGTDERPVERAASTTPADAPGHRGGRRRRALLVAVVLALAALVVVVAAVLASPPQELPGLVRDPAPDATGLVFVDHRDPSTPGMADLLPPEGELTLAYFGYLSCPDICPMTMVDIARAQREVGPGIAGRTTVAFVTVDPGRDDGERLRGYLGHFFEQGHSLPLSPDPGDPDLVGAADRLGVRWEIEPHDGDDGYAVAHSAITYVIDHTGAVVRELPFGTTAEEYAQVLRALLG